VTRTFRLACVRNGAEFSENELPALPAAAAIAIAERLSKDINASAASVAISVDLAYFSLRRLDKAVTREALELEEPWTEVRAIAEALQRRHPTLFPPPEDKPSGVESPPN
jgi:hypothetical protein